MSHNLKSLTLAASALAGVVAAGAFLWRYVPAPLLAGTRAGGPARSARARPPLDTLGEIPADAWLGPAPAGGISGPDLRGSVVLVEFWTYLCYNCKNVEPWVKRVAARYRNQGLIVVGVHTPEFNVERRVENVADYLRRNEITYPVAIDNSFRVWRRYNATNAWPAFLVFDRQGALIYRRAGEDAVAGAEAAIAHALAERSSLEDGWQSGGDGVRFRVRATARPGTGGSARAAVLEVSLAAEPGYKLVKSPPNEVYLELGAGATTPANPALVGEAFTGGDARDVVYFDGPATLAIPIAFSSASAAAPTVRGRITFRVCDTRAAVCVQRERRFAAPIRGT